MEINCQLYSFSGLCAALFVTEKAEQGLSSSELVALMVKCTTDNLTTEKH
jgi:hypothetical protein